MKNLIVFALLFSCVVAFSQEEKMPQAVKTAFKNKYPVTELEGWRIDNNLYYLDFYLEDDAYTSIFTTKGGWVETSKIISDVDIPEQLQEYLGDNFSEGIISYCEKVEIPDSPGFIRIHLSNNGKIIIIQSDYNGGNIKIINEENE